MGMTAANRKGIITDPNVVPLIDVLLVLIIIFMVIQPPPQAKGHKAQIPQPSEDTRERVVPDDTLIVVQLLDGGALKINGEPHTWESLGPRLQAIFNRRASKIAFVQGDDAVLFQEIARAIDILRSSGAGHIGLLSANLAAGQ